MFFKVWTYLTPFYTATIIDFEQANVCCGVTWNEMVHKTISGSFLGVYLHAKKKDMIHRFLVEKLPLQNSSISLANNNAKICIPKISNWYTNSAKLLSVKES